jgi:hypothetical protein
VDIQAQDLLCKTGGEFVSQVGGTITCLFTNTPTDIAKLYAYGQCVVAGDTIIKSGIRYLCKETTEELKQDLFRID